MMASTMRRLYYYRPRGCAHSGRIHDYPSGSAYLPDRVFVRRGRDIPRGGACFFFPSGKPRPMVDCKALKTRAKEELDLSRAVTDTDMQRELAGVTSPEG